MQPPKNALLGYRSIVSVTDHRKYFVSLHKNDAPIACMLLSLTNQDRG
jgi:hypothetical protein